MKINPNLDTSFKRYFTDDWQKLNLLNGINFFKLPSILEGFNFFQIKTCYFKSNK